MKPFFSIIVPTCSRPQALSACLESLAGLHYPHELYEVIVVDDGSELPSEGIVARYRQRIRLTLIRQENAGPASARNAGAQRAQGELLAFTDDDCRPEPGWLGCLARAFGQAPDCMVGGRTVNVLTDNLYSVTSQLIVDIVYRHYNADPRQARFVASNNLAMRAQDFHHIGGFDPVFRTSEDRELCDRWLHQGRRITYCPEARVGHAHALTLFSFVRQHFGYGRGAQRYHRLRSQRQSGSLGKEFGFHLNLRNWLWYPFTQVHASHVLPVALLLGLWQMANFAGFMWEAVRQKVGPPGEHPRTQPESDSRSGRPAA
ncbi:MAG: glycosyltransferase [Chromatiales bacterium]